MVGLNSKILWGITRLRTWVGGRGGETGMRAKGEDVAYHERCWRDDCERCDGLAYWIGRLHY